MSAVLNYVEDEDGMEYAKWICETKRAYAKSGDAKRAARKSLEVNPELKRLCLYKCKACGKYRMTSKKTPIVVKKPVTKKVEA